MCGPSAKSTVLVVMIEKSHTLCNCSGSPSGSPFAAMGKTFGIGASAHLAATCFLHAVAKGAILPEPEGLFTLFPLRCELGGWLETHST